MPAGYRYIVVQLIVGIPPQHHVTKPKAFFQRRKELFLGHVFAAHDPVDINGADFDVTKPAFVDDGFGVGDGFDVACIHERLLLWGRAFCVS